MTRPTWIIDTADRGVPTAAHCERCNFGWERPDDDPQADTLAETARGHHCGPIRHIRDRLREVD
jgi:hypothetical protein